MAKIAGFPGLFPADIECQFRKKLGAVNPKICILDAAARDFTEQVNGATKPLRRLQRRLGHHGHQNLYAALSDLPKAQWFLHLAHIMYIISVADFLCDDLRSHPLMSANARNVA